ncbi:hypothetical protein BGX33_009982 [Mortierella sp. NVP41]|nr:hypothetical protein BGX33_009982 [Mortierella sp. NVP41]
MKGIEFLSLSKKKAPVPAAPKGPTPKTLLLPEILDRIFPFIDDDALHRSIILVCRQWLSMNQHRLIREIALIDDNNRNKAIIARLPRATHLVWHSMDGRLKEKETRKLIQALQENKEFYLQSLQSATQEPVVNNNSNNRKDGLFNPGNKSPFSKNVLRDFNLNGPGHLFISILP